MSVDTSEVAAKFKERGYDPSFWTEMQSIGKPQGNWLKSGYGRDDDYRPDMFADGYYPNMGPEYFANRVKQIAKMIREEVDPIARDLHRATRSTAPNWSPGVCILVQQKWMVVSIHEMDREHTLCWVYWTDEDLSRARAELRAELEHVPAWFKRIYATIGR